jgi:iron complex outermembrane receptor protein
MLGGGLADPLGRDGAARTGAAPLLLVACGLLAAHPARADTTDLSRLSIEELANVEITSVSKRPERLADAAASVFVISNQDLRNSGALSLPEALRLAPNLNVQRVDSTDYGISSRGLNGFESANKLLVLIDGRSVYSPFFAGVEWSQQHVMLADLDRIEVISGPGGALWGANAVNGVINVVSRSADQTLGGLAEAVGGSGDAAVNLRYGVRLGESGAVRVYAQGYDRADTLLNGKSADDGWNGGQAGFRSDFALGHDHLTLQGDIYRDDIMSQIPASPKGKLLGANLEGRWTRTFEDGSTFEAQAYFDRYERIARGILDGVSTYDVQVQQTFQRGRHQVVVGGGYRWWQDRFANFVNGFVLDPPSRRLNLASGFVQDQIDLGDLTLTLGIKGENASFSGGEWMPSARLAWKLSDRAMIWGAVSRVVRDPSRLDRELVFPPFLVRSDFQTEKLVAYELGYRGRPAERLSLTATVFLHDYTDVRSNEITPVTLFPITIGNGLEGRTYGLEAWADYDLTADWRLSGGFTALGKDFRRSPGSSDISKLAAQGHDPALQASVRSQMRISPSLSLDTRLRYVSRTPKELTGGYMDAPAYSEADARLAWQVNDRVELSVAGVNLLDAAHPEATEPRRTEARRSIQAGARVAW